MGYYKNKQLKNDIWLEETQECFEFWYKKALYGTPQQQKFTRRLIRDWFGYDYDDPDYHSCKEIRGARQEDYETFSSPKALTK